MWRLEGADVGGGSHWQQHDITSEKTSVEVTESSIERQGFTLEVMSVLSRNHQMFYVFIIEFLVIP